jgi:hypothetical protein
LRRRDAGLRGWPTAGWTLEPILVPAVGGLLQPTKLWNRGDGSRIISLISSPSTATCPSLAGEYLFHLRIAGVSSFSGAVIRKLTAQ